MKAQIRNCMTVKKLKEGLHIYLELKDVAIENTIMINNPSTF